MNKEERQLVLPGDRVGDKRSMPGPGTKLVRDHVVAVAAGLLQTLGEKVSVLPMNGCYEPRAGDVVLGVITEANPGNWIVDIGAPWLAPLHVSEVPWRVDFGETTSYLKAGDAILCKVLFVDEQKKVQVTLKDRNLSKLEGGEIIEVSPVKVARVIGKSGSMLNLLKEYVECWLFVGQNGRIWINGEPAEVLLGKEVIQFIEAQSHLPGLTEKVKALLESKRPGGLDATITVERARPQRNEEASTGRPAEHIEQVPDEAAPRPHDGAGDGGHGAGRGRSRAGGERGPPRGAGRDGGHREGGREGGRREGGRDGAREGGREGGRDAGRDGDRDGTRSRTPRNQE